MSKVQLNLDNPSLKFLSQCVDYVKLTIKTIIGLEFVTLTAISTGNPLIILENHLTGLKFHLMLLKFAL